VFGFGGLICVPLSLTVYTGDVTPADTLYGRREQILQRRKEVQIQTINHRREYSRNLRELVDAA